MKKPICKTKPNEFKNTIILNNNDNEMASQNKENVLPKITNLRSYAKNYQKKLELQEKNNKNSSPIFNFKCSNQQGFFKFCSFFIY